MSKTNRPTEPFISQDAIARRAYELWQARGCPSGDGGDDWQAARDQLAAEAESNEGCHGRGILLRLFDRLRKKAA